MTIAEFFRDNPCVALAFSGGVDSAYLLYAGLRNKANIQPYFVKTAFQPAFELKDALRLTEQLGVKLTIIEVDILSVEQVVANPVDRCYYCKRALFEALKRQATSDGYDLIIDGTNASDDADDRPGMRALQELGVRSPLRECGISKSSIRKYSKVAELFTWDKPSYACLATRIHTDEPIVGVVLNLIGSSEIALATMGFTNFRMRISQGLVTIQIPKEQKQKALELEEHIIRNTESLFAYGQVDLRGICFDFESR